MVTELQSLNKEQPKSNFHTFLLFWIGQTISQLGSSISNFTIIWWITVTYNSAIYLGLLSFSGYIVGIISAAVFGVYVDKWNQKKILITTDTLSLIGTIILIGLFMGGLLNFSYVLMVSTLQGMLNFLQGITTFALIPKLIPKDQRSRINGLSLLGFGLSGTLGPLFGAVMLASIGLENLHLILLVDAISFIVAVGTLTLLKVPRSEEETTQTEKVPFAQAFKAGFDLLKSIKGAIPHMVIPAAWNFFISPIFVLLPLIVIHQDYFDADAGLLSIFFIANQIAAILASVFFTLVKIDKKYVKNLISAVFVSIVGDAFIVYSLYSLQPIYMIIGMFFLGVSLVYFNTMAQTIWHNVIPQDFQGRVISVRRLFTRIPQALSYLLFTYLADILGFFPVILICFVGFTVLYVYTLLFTRYRQLDNDYAHLLYGED